MKNLKNLSGCLLIFLSIFTFGFNSLGYEITPKLSVGAMGKPLVAVGSELFYIDYGNGDKLVSLGETIDGEKISKVVIGSVYFPHFTAGYRLYYVDQENGDVLVNSGSTPDHEPISHLVIWPGYFPLVAAGKKLYFSNLENEGELILVREFDAEITQLAVGDYNFPHLIAGREIYHIDSKGSVNYVDSLPEKFFESR